MRFNILLVLGLGLFFISLRSNNEGYVPSLILRQICNNTDKRVVVLENLRRLEFILEPDQTIFTEFSLDGEKLPVTEYFEKDIVIKRSAMRGNFLIRDNLNFLIGCTYNMFFESSVAEPNKEPILRTYQANSKTVVQNWDALKKAQQFSVEFAINKEQHGDFNISSRLILAEQESV